MPRKPAQQDTEAHVSAAGLTAHRQEVQDRKMIENIILAKASVDNRTPTFYAKKNLTSHNGNSAFYSSESRGHTPGTNLRCPRNRAEKERAKTIQTENNMLLSRMLQIIRVRTALSNSSQRKNTNSHREMNRSVPTVNLGNTVPMVGPVKSQKLRSDPESEAGTAPMETLQQSSNEPSQMGGLVKTNTKNTVYGTLNFFNRKKELTKINRENLVSSHRALTRQMFLKTLKEV